MKATEKVDFQRRAEERLATKTAKAAEKKRMAEERRGMIDFR